MSIAISIFQRCIHYIIAIFVYNIQIFNQMIKKWVNGIPYEVAFWNGIYRNKRALKSLMDWSKYNKEIELPGFDVDEYLKQCERDGFSQPIILDVGCGMSYCSGNMWNGETINLHYVDPLATYYNRILERNHQNLPAIEFGMMEYLSSFYPEKNVSLVLIQNALDHSSNPLRGILESLMTLHIGGKLYLKHYSNEAEYENYRGFHQFNIDEQDGKLVVWNRQSRIVVDDIVKDFATISTSRVKSSGRYFIANVITLKAPMPNDIIDLNADRKQLCEAVIDLSAQMNNANAMAKYHLRYKVYKVMQFFLKFLSSNTKMRIKMLVSKSNITKKDAH